MHLPQTLTSIRITSRAAMLAAAVFHLALTLSILLAGRSALLPSQFDHEGIGEFARDSRAFLAQANSMADLLSRGEITLWADGDVDFHVRLYSLDLVFMRPLVGSNILAVEPLNLTYYLLILLLTFGLARAVAGRSAAWTASAIVGLWPSLLLHTTQLIRDPLLISAILLLVFVIIELLKKDHDWRSALIAALMATLACFVIRKCRSEMWPVIMAIVFCAAILFVIKMVRERKLFACNSVLLALLCVSMIAIPLTTSVASKPQGGHRLQDDSIWSRIGEVRRKFIKVGLNKSGSTVDSDVAFSGSSDVLKYLPRALEIGYLAPFPSMWFGAGYEVGVIGRLVSDLEMTVTYIAEALACIFMWKRWRYLDAWLLSVATTTGVLALGLVVANIGTLYRLRYPFWILIVIMAAPVITHYICPTGSSFED